MAIIYDFDLLLSRCKSTRYVCQNVAHNRNKQKHRKICLCHILAQIQNIFVRRKQQIKPTMKTEPYKRATDVLYKLTAIYYKNKRYGRYPRFKVRQQTLSYFHTLEDAENRIRKLVEDNRKATTSGGYIWDYYGFEVKEIPFNTVLWWRDDSQHTRTYLEDGTFFAETKVSSIESSNDIRGCEPFKGRAKEECRFKVGDLVEVLSGDTVSLEIVDSLPPSPERVERIYHRTREDFQNMGVEIIDDEMCWRLDHTDDSYVTLDGDEGYMPNHSHPPVVALFPVRRKVPKRLREMLRRGLKKAQNGE